jgi:AraC-like DNA-binding protein
MAQTSIPASEARQDATFDIVYAHTLCLFPDLVRGLGGNPEKLLRDVGIDPSRLATGQPTVGYRSIANLLEHAAAQLQCPDLGMRLATLQGGGKVFGPLGVVMQNSNTLGEALAYVAKHCHAHSLAARVRLEPDRARHGVFVGHEILVDGLPNKRQAVEQLLLLGHLSALEITGGRARVREVRFRLQPLASLNTYRRYFGCDIRFDQCEDGVVFSERDLRCPIVEPDAQRYKMATSFIETHFTRTKPPMQAQVRAVILQLIGIAKCTKERVADELSLHPRTLCRRLKAEGKSFEKLKDEVRRDMALSYLHVTELPLQRIAEKLGYAEHSVLTRSCSRWFAAAPRELRLRAARICQQM